MRRASAVARIALPCTIFLLLPILPSAVASPKHLPSAARPLSDYFNAQPASAAAAIHQPDPAPAAAPVVRPGPTIAGPLSDPRGEVAPRHPPVVSSPGILLGPVIYEAAPQSNDCQFHIDDQRSRLDGAAKNVASYQAPRLAESPYRMTEALTLADGRQIIVETSACWRVEYRFYFTGLSQVPAPDSPDFFPFLRERVSEAPFLPNRVAARDLIGLLGALEQASKSLGAIELSGFNDGPYLRLLSDAHSFTLIADVARLPLR